MCVRKWALRSPDCANALLHVLQAKGFSPECVPIEKKKNKIIKVKLIKPKLKLT